MNKRVLTGLVAVGLIAIAFAKPLGSATSDQTCQLIVHDLVPGIVVGSQTVWETVLVTLVHKGEAVRSTELVTSGTGSYSVNWSQLEPGQYELHFEAKGHGTVIKRIALSPDATSYSQIQSLGDKDELWGSGPTLADLERRLAALEKAKG
jgi:hypothetical protein